MKKILSNPYFDKVVTSLIALGVGLAIYFIIDVRDFVKFKQPYRDEVQDKRLMEVQNSLITHMQFLDSLNCDKIRYIHMRIDNFKDMLYYLKTNKFNENGNESTQNKDMVQVKD